jgi:hypothetical protein
VALGLICAHDRGELKPAASSTPHTHRENTALHAPRIALSTPPHCRVTGLSGLSHCDPPPRPLSRLRSQTSLPHYPRNQRTHVGCALCFPARVRRCVCACSAPLSPVRPINGQRSQTGETAKDKRGQPQHSTAHSTEKERKGTRPCSVGRGRRGASGVGQPAPASQPNWTQWAGSTVHKALHRRACHKVGSHKTASQAAQAMQSRQRSVCAARRLFVPRVC